MLYVVIQLWNFLKVNKPTQQTTPDVSHVLYTDTYKCRDQLHTVQEWQLSPDYHSIYPIYFTIDIKTEGFDTSLSIHHLQDQPIVLVILCCLPDKHLGLNSFGFKSEFSISDKHDHCYDKDR